MEDSEHINETVETYDLLIDSAIEQLKKSKKRSDEHTILECLQKKGNSINQQILPLSIASLSKNRIIINKPSSGKIFFSVKPSTATEQSAEVTVIEILFRGTTLCYQKICGRLLPTKHYTQ